MCSLCWHCQSLFVTKFWHKNIVYFISPFLCHFFFSTKKKAKNGCIAHLIFFWSVQTFGLTGFDQPEQKWNLHRIGCQLNWQISNQSDQSNLSKSLSDGLVLFQTLSLKMYIVLGILGSCPLYGIYNWQNTKLFLGTWCAWIPLTSQTELPS